MSTISHKTTKPCKDILCVIICSCECQNGSICNSNDYVLCIGIYKKSLARATLL